MKMLRLPAVCQAWFRIGLLCLLMIGIAGSGPVWALTVHTLGVHDDVTVLEVSGLYDSMVNGQVDSTPQREVAKEFIRTHGDRHDFLVVFTNFDFLMPSPSAQAFFTPVRNDVEGIGIPLFDYSPAFSPTGTALDRLQGVIDMASLNSHRLQPSEPGYEETLQVLTHELMHRWGAYVDYLSDDGGVSERLLGLDSSHWNYLLDSQGSTLYGNNWQDNQNGTFTSTIPDQGRFGESFGRIFSPLDLYLMGLIPPEAVPDLLLLDNPGIDAEHLPEVGITLAASAESVSIEQIIAVEGPRQPASEVAPKEFTVGFAYAVLPGTWAADSRDGQAELAAISRLGAEWKRRFAILTDGVGQLTSSSPAEPPLEQNPGLSATVPLLPAAIPAANLGIEWLVTVQDVDGAWYDQSGIVERDTALAAVAFERLAPWSESLILARQWLATCATASVDFVARTLLSSVTAASDPLLTARNLDGGWGSAAGYQSNPIDTALALQGLTRSASLADQELNQTLAYLLAAQQADGGWGPNSYVSMVGATAEVLMALHPFRQVSGVQAGIDRGKSWLLARQNSDGGFGNNVSTVHDSSLALLALKMVGVEPGVCTQAVDYLLAGQSQSGNWQGNVFLTALAVTALHAGQVAPDLAVFAGELTLTPELIEQAPGQVSVTVPLHNLSTTPLAAVRVELFLEEISDTPLDRVFVDVEGQETARVTLTATLVDPGLSRLIVVADPLNVIEEPDEQNNLAERLLPVEMQPPVAGFELSSSSWPEGTGTVELAVTLSYPWHEALQLDYVLDRSGSSVDDQDHRLVDGLLSIEAGETLAWLVVPLIDDQQVEVDETLVVVLTGTSDESGRHELMIQDDELPQVTILSPLSEVSAETNPQLLFTSTASNNVVTIDGQPSSARTGDLLGPFADGPHTLKVVTTNSLGLSGEDRVDFQIDTSLPQITIHSPAPGSLVGAQPLFDCEVSGAMTFEYRLDGQTIEVVAGERLGPLVDGEHRLQVVAVNLAGSQASVELIFTVDSRPPRVEIGYPVSGYLQDVAPTLEYTVDEPAMVTVWLDDIRQPDELLPSLGTLTAGLHRIRVEATDAAGNLGSSQIEFVVTTGDAPPYGLAPGWPVVPEGEYGGLAVDANGSVYLALRSAPREFSLIKYAADGTLLWKSTNSSFFNLAGGLWVDGEPKDLAVDSQGNIFAAGWGWLNERYYGFLAKYDSQGRYLSHRLFDTGRLYGDAKAYALVVDDQDRVYVGGNAEYDCIMQSGLSATIFVARFDNSLNLEAHRILGDPRSAGSFRFSYPQGMAVAPDGRLLLAGSSGGGQMLLWALDSELSAVQPLATGTTGTYGTDVVADRHGSIYLVGRGSSSTGYVLKVDATGSGSLQTSVLLPSSPLVSAHALADGTLLTLDSSGGLHRLDADLNLLWSEHFNSLLDSKLAGHRRGWVVAAGSSGVRTMAAAAHLVSPLAPGLSFAAPVFHTSQSQVLLHGLVDPLASVELASQFFELESVDIDPETGLWQMLVDGLEIGSNLVEVTAIGAGGLRQLYQCQVIVDQQSPQVQIFSPVDGSHHLIRPTLNYEVSDGEVRVLVNGVELTKKSGFTLDSLRAGENLVRVESRDLAGNLGFAEVVITAADQAVGELPLTPEWLARFGSGGEQRVVAMERDGVGNLYLFGDSEQAFPGYISQGLDLYVAKFNEAGEQLALWQFGRPANDSAVDLIVRDDGRFTLLSNSEGTDSSGESFNEMVLASYSADGQLLWEERLDSGAYDHASALAVDPEGDLLVAGWTMGRLHNQKYGGLRDYFISKYSASGRRAWTLVSNREGDDFILDLQADADGVIYACGRANDSGSMTLMRFGAEADLVWSQDYKYGNHYMTGDRLIIDSDSAYVLTTSNYLGYYFLVNYSKSGTQLWAAYQYAPDLEARALAVGPDGHLFVTGSVADKWSSGSSFDGHPALGAEDLVLAKHSRDNGQMTWSQQWGDYDSQQGVALLFDQLSGQGYLAATSNGRFGGDSFGDRDLIWARLAPLTTPSGPQLTVDPFPSPTNSTTILLSGTVSIDATLQLEIVAPADSATISGIPVVDYTGLWQLEISNLTPNTITELRVIAINRLGMTEQLVMVEVDTNPPWLIVDPLPDVVNGSAQWLSGTVEAGASLSLSNNGGAFQLVTVVGNDWSLLLTDLQQGENVIGLRAVDAAGNCNELVLTLDCQPPSPMIATLSMSSLLHDEQAEIILDVIHIDPPGATLILREWLDIDQNGVADSTDPLLRQTMVRDGGPEDIDRSVDGQLQLGLNYLRLRDRQHAPGTHLLEIETGGSSALAQLEVIPAFFQQGFVGQVADSTGQAVAGAEVGLYDPWQRSLGFVYSRSDGSYQWPVGSPGDYLLIPAAEGLMFDKFDLQLLALNNGEQLTRDLQLRGGSLAVTGSLNDELTTAGIPGVRLWAESELQLAMSMTDTSGHYVLNLDPGDYLFNAESSGPDSLSANDYLGTLLPLGSFSLTAAGMLPGMRVSPVTRQVCGLLLEESGAGVAGLTVRAVADDRRHLSQATSGPGGSFCLGLDTERSWSVDLDPVFGQVDGYLAVPQLLAAGSEAMLTEPMTVFKTLGLVEGYLLDQNLLGVAGLGVAARELVSGTMAQVTSAADGRYRLELGAGEWQLTVDTGQGYQEVEPLTFSLLNDDQLEYDFALLESPAMENSIQLISAVYNDRKQILTVEASSLYADANLEVVGYGPMTFVRQFKETYIWTLVVEAGDRPTAITVLGLEGSVTVAVE